MNPVKFKRLQEEYGCRECPECGGNMYLHDDEYGQLYECCHDVECGYIEDIDEDDI